MAQRRVRFSMKELAGVAASSIGAGRCVHVEKCPDGLYNKAYVFRMDDGREVIGKVPNPNAGLPHYSTASEVATMDYVGVPPDPVIPSCPKQFTHTSISRRCAMCCPHQLLRFWPGTLAPKPTMLVPSISSWRRPKVYL
jgi:hypothetical protein